MLGHGRSREGLRLRLVGAVLGCLTLATAEAAAQTDVIQAQGLRLSSHACFASATDNARLDCLVGDFTFPQTGHIEGRRVRLTDNQQRARFFRRADVRDAAQTDSPAPAPVAEPAAGAALRAHNTLVAPEQEMANAEESDDDQLFGAAIGSVVGALIGNLTIEDASNGSASSGSNLLALPRRRYGQQRPAQNRIFGITSSWGDRSYGSTCDLAPALARVAALGDGRTAPSYLIEPETCSILVFGVDDDALNAAEEPAR